MKAVGLDLSLASTGIAVIVDGGAHTETIKLRAGLTGVRRLDALRSHLREFVHGAHLVAVEGAAYNQQGGQQGHHERAGLWWLMAWTLYRAEIPLAVIGPTQIKKYATGKGNAKKAEVVGAVARRYPAVTCATDDEADALVLAAMAARKLGHPIDGSLPNTQVEAMARAQWPHNLREGIRQL